MNRSFTDYPKRFRLLTAVIGLSLFFSTANLCPADEPSPKPNSGIKITEDDFEQKDIRSSAANGFPASTQPGSIRQPSTIANPWIALLLVIVLILIAAWLFRKFTAGSNRLFGSLPVLQVLGRTALSSKHTLALIKLDTRLLLIGITDHEITPLLSFENEDEISRILTLIEQNRPTGIAGGFRNLFSHENHEFETEKDPSASNSVDSSDKNAENNVFQLKNELNTLLIKIQKMKGNGS
jgi:flagellar biogenesis protein FliO